MLYKNNLCLRHYLFLWIFFDNSDNYFFLSSLTLEEKYYV